MLTDKVAHAHISGAFDRDTDVIFRGDTEFLTVELDLDTCICVARDGKVSLTVGDGVGDSVMQYRCIIRGHQNESYGQHKMTGRSSYWCQCP